MKTIRLLGAIALAALLCASASALDTASLVDANGKHIGPVLTVRWADNLDGATDIVDVVFKVGDRRILMYATDREFFGASGRGLYFTTTDCTGNTFINANAADRFFNEYVVIRDLDSPSYYLWMRKPQSSIVPRTVRSAKFYVGASAPCVPINEQLNVGLAKSMLDLSTVFQPPFRLQTSPDVVDLLNPP